MREILFRGKNIYNDWIYGYLCQHRGEPVMDNNGMVLEGSDYYIRDWAEKIDTGFYGCNYKVFPSTVGQFTGLTDKNGKKIFEGDIVKYKSGSTVLFHEVVFERRNGCAYFGVVMGENETWDFNNSFPSTLFEIVGNIHDNPELLEVDE